MQSIKEYQEKDKLKIYGTAEVGYYEAVPYRTNRMTKFWKIIKNFFTKKDKYNKY